MKLLTIGTDRKLFEEGSAVQKRALEYAAKMDEYHVVVFSLKKHSCKEYSLGGLHIYPTNSFSRLFYIFDAIRIGKKITRNFEIDIVSTQDPFECGFAGWRIAKKFNTPLQLQAHTDFLSSYFKNSFLNRIRVYIAKYTIPKAIGIRTVSSDIADSIRNTFPNLKAKIEILPIFVDAEQIKNEQPKKDIKLDFPQFNNVIFMASRLEPEKQIDVALCAFKGVLMRFPKAGLVISGDGRERKILDMLARGLGISNQVVFTGWSTDLVSYYKTADVYLLTSEFEGYGMSLIEAGAAGCPIVATSVGIAKTDLFKDGENSFVCPVGDVDCLVKSVVELISDESKRKLFAEKMLNDIRVTTISKEDYVEKYVGLLSKLIKHD